MKRFLLIVIPILLLISACSAPGAQGTAAQEPTAAAQTAEDLRAKIDEFESAGDFEAMYQAAFQLTQLDPADTNAYIDAATALLQMSNDNYKEINRLMELGGQNAQDVKALSDWAQQNQPDVSIMIPFAPDYSPEQVNAEGTTTGNLTNAAKYINGWWQGGLLTWQGDWVYFAQPNENFAVYKVKSDGTGYQRVGQICGSSLNVVGDWLYYLNINDGRPSKVRTDGSMGSMIVDEEGGFLSVSGDWIYYNSDKLYKMRTDGSEKTTLTEDFTIFPCVSGEWVYYAIKSETGGLWRVSVDGGQPQQVAQGGVMTYCVTGDMVYYVDTNSWNILWRVSTDGTGAEEIMQFDTRITTINVADGKLYLNLGVSNDMDGFATGADIVTLDLATLEKLQSIQADTEPLCTGPDGRLYFFRYGEGMAWYSMDKNGEVSKLGN